MNRSLTAAACALLLCACDEAVRTDGDAARAKPAVNSEAQFEAEIMIGRVEVMQDQTQRGLKVLGTGAGPEIEASGGTDAYRRLAASVVRYNSLARSACGSGAVSGNICGAPYLPLWYAGRARPDLSPAGLKTMAEEMQTTMIPLWDGVCVKAIAKSGDEHFCAIE